MVFVLGLVITSGSLAVLTEVAPDAGHLVELAALILANLTATLIRFLLMRTWVFSRRRPRRTARPPRRSR